MSNKIEVVETIEGIDWSLEAIGAPKAWEKTKGKGVKIVVIDTGVDTSHPDLDVKFKFDMINKSTNVTDDYGHGTHVAGLLTGKYTGVAPEADLYVIKVLDEQGNGSASSVMDGITHAINIKADVLSISLGAPHSIPLIIEQRIVDAYEAGITIVSAVGNNGNHLPLYPARMNEVIGVGGYDKNLNRTNFTNRGYDVLAPSVDILSTFKDGKYARMTGTSFASPLVAGGIALLISYYREQGKKLKPKEIKSMISGKFDLTKLL